MMSGLTIGRGYDMSLRKEVDVCADLSKAGLDADKAALLSGGAGLHGSEAKEFITDNNLKNFKITGQQQLNLFNLDYPRFVADTEREATKADVTARYGATDWGALNGTIKELLVDLRYRGDYPLDSRSFCKPPWLTTISPPSAPKSANGPTGRTCRKTASTCAPRVARRAVRRLVYLFQISRGTEPCFKKTGLSKLAARP